jgi:hypothetical protein
LNVRFLMRKVQTSSQNLYVSRLPCRRRVSNPCMWPRSQCARLRQATC